MTITSHQKFKLREYYSEFNLKPCWSCMKVRSFSDFCKSAWRSDSMSGRCIQCDAEYKDKNRIQLRASGRKRDAKNRAAISAKNREYWARTKDKRNATKRLRHDPVKSSARSAVKCAILNGSIIAPGKCSLCEATERIEAHHADYSKKLDVVWLCSSCHHRVHSGVVVLESETP